MIASDETGNGNYRLNRIFSPQDLRQFSFSILEFFKPHLRIFADWGGAMFSALVLWQLVKVAITFCLNCKLLYRSFGWSYKLLASTMSSVTHYILKSSEKSAKAQEVELSEIKCQK